MNSYADNLAQLTKNTADVLALAEAFNEALSSTEAEIRVTEDIALPSFSNVVKRVNRAEDTIAKFTQGKGVVETDDGTYRKIKVTNISRPPETITDLSEINTFAINPNWFFESLQYPRCVVKLNLKGKIDDSADRVYVNRVILDANALVGTTYETVTDYYNENILNQNLGYTSLIALLNQDAVPYREDRDEISLPLTYEKYKGEFGVTEIRLVKDEKGFSRTWYYLDNITYSLVDENGIEQSNGYIIAVGDYLRFNNSLYKVTKIVQDQKRVQLEYAVGYEAVGAGDVLELYNEPFSEKIIDIGIGINEIDIIYVKGVNEDFNLISRDWSSPISFITNELQFADNNNINFATYYAENVADFGKEWIAQAKEKQIHAYNGLTPYAPVINADDLRVVQINTQLDATLDKETYNQLTAEIASTKSNITATRNTISSNKDLLIQSTSSDERTNIQNLINTDTETLNSLTTQYNSLVEELNTLLNESGAIDYTPKYHIRGFFPIPQSRYLDEQSRSGEQAVIGFDIMYRYLHTDETGVKLNTYEYTTSNDAIQTGVFTDWNMMTSAILTKIYDDEQGVYVWKNESTADGTKININQIDIPIRSGEKVEIKVRSISEAGYPYNPVKSDWSPSVIISFPENLTSDDSVTTILETVKSDMTAVVLQQTMSAAGVYTHLADSNSTYKHTSKNISYTDSVTDASGNTTLTEMSLQDKIEALSRIKEELTNAITAELEKYIKQITDIKKILGYKFTEGETITIESGTYPEQLPGNTNIFDYISTH